MSETTGVTPGETKLDEDAASRRSRRGRPTEGPDLALPANRREIPLTSFDFTAGAYKRTVRARRTSFGVIGTLIVVVAFLAFSTLSTVSAANQAQGSLDALTQRESQVVSSFGQAAGVSVDPKLVIDRELELTDGFNAVASRQADIAAVLADVAKIQVPGVQLTEVRVGAEAAASAGEGVLAEGVNGVPIMLTAASTDLLTAVTWADQVRQSPLLTDLTPRQDGMSVTLIGRIAPARPPVASLARLDSAGVLFVPTPGSPAALAEKAAADGAGTAEGEAAPAEGEAAPTGEAAPAASPAPASAAPTGGTP